MGSLSSVRVDLPTMSTVDEGKNQELLKELLVVYSAVRSLQDQISQVYGYDLPTFSQAQNLEIDSLYSASERTNIKVKAQSAITAFRALNMSMSGTDILVRHLTGDASLDTGCIGLSESNIAAGDYFFVRVYPAIITVPFDLQPGKVYYGWADGQLITDPSSVPVFPSGNFSPGVGLAVGKRKLRVGTPSGFTLS